MSNNTYTQKQLNAILREHKKRRNSLSGAGARADLSGADLSGMDLSGADLRGIKLANANLAGADLMWARLSGVDLRGANLQDADLMWVILKSAILYNADCRRAHLSRANLAEAQLHGTRLDGADLTSVNLERAKGLAWADCAFIGHGETGRRLLAIRTKPGGKLLYYCGCFRGDESDLRTYIRTGARALAKSRLFALEFLKQAVTFKPRTLED